MGTRTARLLSALALGGLLAPGCGDEAKTREAMDNLDRLYRSAANYFSAPHAAADGVKLPCQFPRTTACVPAGSPCDHASKQYPADAARWQQNPTFKALGFAPDDPHYFKYCITSSGTRDDATFTATAHADLDCDGEWSTFRRTARGKSKSGVECTLESSSEFVLLKKLE